MEFLKPLVSKSVNVFLVGGGFLDGTLMSVSSAHLVLRDSVEKKGAHGEKVEVERFVCGHAILYAEEQRGQRTD